MLWVVFLQQFQQAQYGQTAQPQYTTDQYGGAVQPQQQQQAYGAAAAYTNEGEGPVKMNQEQEWYPGSVFPDTRLSFCASVGGSHEHDPHTKRRMLAVILPVHSTRASCLLNPPCFR